MRRFLFTGRSIIERLTELKHGRSGNKLFCSLHSNSCSSSNVTQIPRNQTSNLLKTWLIRNVTHYLLLTNFHAATE